MCSVTRTTGSFFYRLDLVVDGTNPLRFPGHLAGNCSSTRRFPSSGNLLRKYRSFGFLRFPRNTRNAVAVGPILYIGRHADHRRAHSRSTEEARWHRHLVFGLRDRVVTVDVTSLAVAGRLCHLSLLLGDKTDGRIICNLHRLARCSLLPLHRHLYHHCIDNSQRLPMSNPQCANPSLHCLYPRPASFDYLCFRRTVRLPSAFHGAARVNLGSSSLPRLYITRYYQGSQRQYPRTIKHLLSTYLLFHGHLPPPADFNLAAHHSYPKGVLLVTVEIRAPSYAGSALHLVDTPDVAR